MDIDDEEEPATGEEVYQYYLEEHSEGYRTQGTRIKLTPDYKGRLENERKNWKLQEEELVRAYMEWKANGPLSEEQEEDRDWFTCKVCKISGMTTFSIEIFGDLLIFALQALKQFAYSMSVAAPPVLPS
jgi:hypothetical protein